MEWGRHGEAERHTAASEPSAAGLRSPALRGREGARRQPAAPAAESSVPALSQGVRWA